MLIWWCPGAREPFSKGFVLNSDTFKALVNKEIQVKLGDDVSVPLTVTGVEDGKPIECDDDNVCKNPFTVLLSGGMQQRVPEASFEVTGDGIDAGTQFFIQALADLNPDDDKIPYSIVVG